MRRIAILADIHGNLPALEAVERDLEQFAVDCVVVAGDAINWGPFSEQVLELITARSWPVIRGNHEFYLLDYGTPRAPTHWQNSAQYPQLPHLVNQLAGKWHMTIAAWPDTLSLRFYDAPPLRVVHGSPVSPWEPLYPGDPDEQIVEKLAGVEETTVVAAHTHLPMDRTVGHLHVINPGSVGVPLDGLRLASYVLLEGSSHGWQARFRRIPFDYDRLFAEFRLKQWVEQYGAVGQLAVEEFQTARSRIAPFLTWRKRHHPDETITTALLEEFRQVNPFDYTAPPYIVNMGLTDHVGAISR